MFLSDAQVHGHPEATGFTYAFDCGNGEGYGAYTGSNSVICPTGAVGSRTVRGKVRDRDGDEAEFSGTVTVLNLAQTITFTSQAPNPTVIGGTYAVSATGGESGNRLSSAG